MGFWNWDMEFLFLAIIRDQVLLECLHVFFNELGVAALVVRHPTNISRAHDSVDSGNDRFVAGCPEEYSIAPLAVKLPLA